MSSRIESIIAETRQWLADFDSIFTGTDDGPFGDWHETAPNWIPTYRGRFLSDAVLDDLCSADATRENDASWAAHGDGLGIPRSRVWLTLPEDYA